ncbi:MAG TPA: alpha/beta hydrolase family protein [Thermoleophilaceae bacterium]|nr:alpha/beta hydrolase family protein [Thermoleophilaceae bacterium]
MASRFRLPLALLALVLAFVMLAGTANADAARITGERRVSARVIELTIATSAFAGPTKVHVNLPVGYDAAPGRRWPVTYVTAGTMNTYATFNNFLGGEKLARGHPAIIVSPNGNSGYWSDWFNAGAFGPPKYETYVIDQLIPLIDARFRTRASRSQRAIFGISMGGYGATMLAAHHPDLFAAAASLSGAVDSNLQPNGAVLSLSSTFDDAPADAIYGPRSEQEVRWRGHNPTDLAANLRHLDLQVRTANGVPNPALGENPLSADSVSCAVEAGVYQASVSMHRRLDALGMRHTWKDYGAGCHTVANFRRETLHTLAVFERVFADPPPAPAKFEHRSIEPRFGVWGWHVAADRGRALEFMRLEVAGDLRMALTGSGTTSVTTPATFRGLRAVDVSTPAGTRVARPDRAGRLRFPVPLGRPHRAQQFTAAARGAGQDRPGYFTRASVRLAPHARVLVATRRRKGALKVCLRGIGGAVPKARLRVRGRGGRALTRSLAVRVGERRRCRSVARGRIGRGRYVVAVRARDGYGHALSERKVVRARR